MKSMQFSIVNLDNNLRAQWGKDAILFDTQEEAEEMITLFSGFFKYPRRIEIRAGIYFIDDSINYKDLKQREDFIKEVKMQEDLDNEIIRTPKKIL